MDVIADFSNDHHRLSVIELWQTVFGYETAHNLPSIAIDKKLAVSDGLFFIALAANTVVGTILAGYDGHRGWLYSVAVHPSHRRRGLGAKLVIHAENALAALGCMKINLQILGTNDRVEAFYESLGYSTEPRISMGKKIDLNIAISPVALVAAQPGDLDDLVSIRIEAMRESLERIGRFDPVRARARFINGFVAHNTRHIERSGERVGFVVVKTHLDGLLLDHFYVKPSAQGSGVGSAVLTQIFREADAAALPIRLGALKESASNRFYTRHGFQYVESDQFDNYYVRPGVVK